MFASGELETSSIQGGIFPSNLKKCYKICIGKNGIKGEIVMSERESAMSSAFFIERTEEACEREFGHLLERESAEKYGDAYPKYVENAAVRLEGMAIYAEHLLKGHASSMTVAGILSRWRNKLQVVKEVKEDMRVFARSEKEILTLFRNLCKECLEKAAGDRNGDAGPELTPDQARRSKDAVLAFLGELFPMPELYDLSDRYPIPEETNVGRQQEKRLKITVELTEREARAYETMVTAEMKIRAALAEAANSSGQAE